MFYRYVPRHRKERRVIASLKQSLALTAAVFLIHQPSAEAVEVEVFPIVAAVDHTEFDQLVRNVSIAHRENSISRRAEREWVEFDERLSEEIAAIEEQKRKEEEARKRAEEARKKAEAEAKKKAEEEAKKKAEAEAKRWIAPVKDYRISATFGQSGDNWSSTHTGLDFAAEAGTKVLAVSSGKIIFAAVDGPYGNKIAIEHWDGTVTWYAHLSSFEQTSGKVAPGDVIGRVGSTGNSTGPHLHLEVRPDNGGPVDPYTWLSERGAL